MKACQTNTGTYRPIFKSTKAMKSSTAVIVGLEHSTFQLNMTVRNFQFCNETYELIL